MLKCQVRTPSQALAYLVDCTLATVADLAMKKSRPVGEFRRQINIAQTGVQWMKDMGVSAEGTRAVEVERVGSVEEWAKQYYPKA